jgi:endonuclease/exonuclease/phosphatase family metal-dependent hydrolase
MKKFTIYTLTAITSVSILLLALLFGITYHPGPEDEVRVICKDNSPIYTTKDTLTVMSWNVQFLAGKKHVFFFDVPDENGPHDRPEPEEIQKTLEEVVRVIKEKNPDVILFQELDEDAKRTDYADQLTLIWDKLPEYNCGTSAFYWRNRFIPHPRVMGSTGLKLSTLSKYKIDSATRHALPIIPYDFITRQFALKRAILETRIPIQEGGYISAMNTHLDAFAQGYDTMERQVVFVKNLLLKRNDENVPWFIGGDFNLLPPGFPLEKVYQTHREYYNPQTELNLLFASFDSVIPLELMLGERQKEYFTHIANDPDVKGEADRTIDYIFHSKSFHVNQSEVLQKSTAHISDHFPMIVNFNLNK